MIIFDARWCGNHGIGRFAREIKTRCFSEACNTSKIACLKGSIADALKPYDFLKMDWCIFKKKAVFFSPSYTVPYWSAHKSIFTIHDLMHLDYEEYASLKYKLYYNGLVKRACKKGLKILTVSEFTKNRIIKWAGIDEDKVVVVGNGVDDQYRPCTTKQSNQDQYILYVGNKKPHKNLVRMLKAYSKSRACHQYSFYLSGLSTPALDRLIREYNLESKVKFLGFIDEKKLPSLYQNASLSLQASLYEGFGLPILESMACGTPVVTSTVTAMPEIAGDAAVLVDPYNVESIAAGMDALCFDEPLRNKLIYKGVKRANIFTWEKVAKKVDKVLIEALISLNKI